MKPNGEKTKGHRRSPARRSRKRHITAAEAKRRAARYLAIKMFKGLTVLDGEDVRYNIYSVRGKETWLIQQPSSFPESQPTQVVVVCKRSGRILYAGSASDEG
jgi:hypothetical protein